MVLCITPANSRPIAEIRKIVRAVASSFGTDREKDGGTDGQTEGQRNDRIAGHIDWLQYPSVPMAVEGKNIKNKTCY